MWRHHGVYIVAPMFADLQKRIKSFVGIQTWAKQKHRGKELPRIVLIFHFWWVLLRCLLEGFSKRERGTNIYHYVVWIDVIACVVAEYNVFSKIKSVYISQKKTNTGGDQLRDFARETSNPEFFKNYKYLSNLNTEKYVWNNNGIDKLAYRQQLSRICDCKLI